MGDYYFGVADMKYFLTLFIYICFTNSASAFGGDGCVEIMTSDMTLNKLKKRAEQGDLQAQFDLCLYYEHDNDTPQDCTEIFNRQKTAAEHGNSSAQLAIGKAYSEGEFVSQDYIEALKWYKLAANNGNFMAMIFIGRMYEEGKGVAQDSIEAKKWKAKAEAKAEAKARHDF